MCGVPGDSVQALLSHNTGIGGQEEATSRYWHQVVFFGKNQSVYWKFGTARGPDEVP